MKRVRKGKAVRDASKKLKKTFRKQYKEAFQGVMQGHAEKAPELGPIMYHVKTLQIAGELWQNGDLLQKPGDHQGDYMFGGFLKCFSALLCLGFRLLIFFAAFAFCLLVLLLLLVFQ